MKRTENIHSKIWFEQPEHDNPFAAQSCYCRGYDVYDELLTRASWVEYLYLLFRGERPTARHARLLELLAIALANPGLRDHSVQAAMNAGVGGSSHAACLMAALAVGAGQLGGARDVFEAMRLHAAHGNDLERWMYALTNREADERADVWPVLEHPPGFDPNGVRCATPVLKTLNAFAANSPGTALRWVQEFRDALETAAAAPLAMSGVAAAALIDLGLRPEHGEMLYLLLRLPGAAVHALEQEETGYRNYPFHRDGVELMDDPLRRTDPQAPAEQPR